MRRSLTVAIILGLLAGALAAPAEAQRKKKKKPKKVEREMEWVYDAPALGAAGAGVCLYATNSCVELMVARGEKFINVKIEDQLGLPVLATVTQDVDGSGNNRTVGTVCGETDEPIEITPGVQVLLFPWAMGGASCPGIATTGTVTAVFSNLP